MKTPLILLTLVFSSHAFAANQPKVTCSLDYSTKNFDGTDRDYIRGPVATLIAETEARTSNRGYSLRALLKQSCAVDGGPCAGYDLEVEVSHGAVSTYSSLPITRKDRFQRLYTQLKSEHLVYDGSGAQRRIYVANAPAMEIGSVTCSIDNQN